MGLRDRCITLAPASEESMLTYISDEAARGLYSVSGYFQGLQTESNASFLRRYQAQFGPWTPPLSTLSESVFEAVHIWWQAARKAEDSRSNASRGVPATAGYCHFERGPTRTAAAFDESVWHGTVSRHRIGRDHACWHRRRGHRSRSYRCGHSVYILVPGRADVRPASATRSRRRISVARIVSGYDQASRYRHSTRCRCRSGRRLPLPDPPLWDRDRMRRSRFSARSVALSGVALPSFSSSFLVTSRCGTSGHSLHL